MIDDNTQNNDIDVCRPTYFHILSCGEKCKAYDNDDYDAVSNFGT